MALTGDHTVTFAGSVVSIGYDTEQARQFLTFLFADIPCGPPVSAGRRAISLKRAGEPGTYTLSTDCNMLFRGRLGVNCAAVLFDAVIYHLLNKARGGVALHAGAVACRDKIILLPGQSGSGKSTLTAWLTARGFSYLTDELIFISEDAQQQIQFFSRPICLKSGSVSVIKNKVRMNHLGDMLEDDHGVLIPHRLLNPDFTIVSAPSLLMFLPTYRDGSPLEIRKVSAAQLCTLLMNCHVNARNLEGHGFRHIARIARSTPAYRLTYGTFHGLAEPLAALLDEL